MQADSVDIPDGMGYNKSNDLYERVADHYGTATHIVKMDEQKPINDNGCKHETLEIDPEDTIGDAVYHGCTNPKCGIGFYVQT